MAADGPRACSLWFFERHTKRAKPVDDCHCRRCRRSRAVLQNKYLYRGISTSTSFLAERLIQCFLFFSICGYLAVPASSVKKPSLRLPHTARAVARRRIIPLPRAEKSGPILSRMKRRKNKKKSVWISGSTAEVKLLTR